LKVVKRNGSTEELTKEKIEEVLEWACEGLSDVNPATVLIQAKLHFTDGMETSAIHDMIIKAASDLISETQPEYQYVAGRLLMTKLRKIAFGEHEVPDFRSHIKDMILLGKYDPSIWSGELGYSREEIDELGKYIDHDRDMDFTFAAMSQWKDKYLVQNRVTGEVFESPQQAIMLIGMCLFRTYGASSDNTRIAYCKKFYDAVSEFKISLPTPIMGGVRTPTKQFSSCVLIEAGDSLSSINATSSAIVNYISQRAGIGINAGRIRALGSPIRGGEAFHTGSIPFYKHFQTAVKSCSQGGIRGGAATLFYPWWHKDVESFIVLKNNKGTEENRVRHLDYGIQFNRFFYQKAIKDETVNLFCPQEAVGLYEAFAEDQDRFTELYEKYSDDLSISRKTVKAKQLLMDAVQERAATGRVYIQNIDHCNVAGPFDSYVAPVRQSNLCLEIALPTAPLSEHDNMEGEIALCTLAAFNFGEIDDPSEFRELSDIIVRALDALLDYQGYPSKVAAFAKERRALGVGIINYAYWLAKNGLKYSDGSANNLTHEWFEAMQYNLLRASNTLAKEQGACKKFNETKYAQGMCPLDWYNKSTDKLHTALYKCDWESLRISIEKYGLRNSTLTALMPAETSAIISNATNGIEPPRGLVVTKGGKGAPFKVVVPEVQKLFDNYELLWDIPNNKGYLELVAIMQKFVDQAISANTNYNPFKYQGNLVPMKEILDDILTAYKNGVKTLYYHNTFDGSGVDQVEEEDDGCASGSCKL